MVNNPLPPADHGRLHWPRLLLSAYQEAVSRGFPLQTPANINVGALGRNDPRITAHVYFREGAVTPPPGPDSNPKRTAAPPTPGPSKKRQLRSSTPGPAKRRRSKTPISAEFVQDSDEDRKPLLPLETETMPRNLVNDGSDRKGKGKAREEDEESRGRTKERKGRGTADNGPETSRSTSKPRPIKRERSASAPSLKRARSRAMSVATTAASDDSDTDDSDDSDEEHGEVFIVSDLPLY